MQHGMDFRAGHTVRLTTPYYDAARGIYTVLYVYRNGWLAVVSHRDERRYDVPERLCRQVATSASPASQQRRVSLQQAEGQLRGLNQQLDTHIGEEDSASQVDQAK